MNQCLFDAVHNERLGISIGMVLLMTEILHQLIGSFSHYL